MEKKQYIANCISTILEAEIHITRQNERDLDIAEAVVIASTEGIHSAHAYLVDLATYAKNGCYVEPKELVG
jgi:hypothetical protein